MSDKNMIGGMCQLAAMDYQDVLMSLAKIFYDKHAEIERAFWIIETTIEIQGMLITGDVYEHKDKTI